MSEAKRVVQAVGESQPYIWFVELAYEEGDSGHAVGSVYTMDAQGPETQRPVQVLSSNDLLTTLWVSPQGNAWVASASGHVATTAAMPGSPDSGFIYNSPAPAVKWCTTRLPAVKATGLPPNVGVLWGVNDQQVYAGCYSGHIYRWDGRAWMQVYEGPGDGKGSIKAFAGTDSSDVYAVGQNTTILHFDGNRWQQLRVPGLPNGNENFTGIRKLAGNVVLIAGNGMDGRLIQGGLFGLTEVVRTSIQLVDMVELGERTLFATGDGVAEWLQPDLRMIKPGFSAVSAWRGVGRAFFAEAEQPTAAFVKHEPDGANGPWRRQKH
jgi:hypothetical protein